MKRPTRNRILTAALAGAGFVALNLASLPALADGSIVVRNFVLSHGIQDREPISETESFNVDDGKAFAFARIQNTGDPTMVSFVWEYGDTTHATVPVSVGTSPGWRTWSTSKLRPGDWRVKLVDEQGEVLLEKAFTVEASSSTPAMGGGYGNGYGNGNGNGYGNGYQSGAGSNEMGASGDNAVTDDVPASVTFPAQ